MERGSDANCLQLKEWDRKHAVQQASFSRQPFKGGDEEESDEEESDEEESDEEESDEEESDEEESDDRRKKRGRMRAVEGVKKDEGSDWRTE